MSEHAACIWTDGGSRSNPGPAAIGVVIRQPDGTLLREFGRYLGSPISNNQAEYRAFISALEVAQELHLTHLTCYLDSKLVVEQLHGRYRVKDVGLQQLWHEARGLVEQFADVAICYVPREQNREADRLVNEALDEAVGRS